MSYSINTLSLKNFKAFKHLPDLKIKPLTILAGTNSSGKSSILQSILLLKQTFESHSNIQLLLNGNYTKLGTFKDIVYEKNENSEVEIAFNAPINKYYLAEMRYFIPDNIKEDSNNVKVWVYDFSYRISFEEQMVKAPVYEKDKIIGYKDEKRVIIKAFEISFLPQIQQGQNSEETGYLKFNHQQDKTYTVSWKLFKRTPDSVENFKKEQQETLIEKIEGKKELKVDFANLRPIKILDNDIPQEIGNIVFYLGDFLKRILGRYNYIGPHRIEPQKRYVYENEVNTIGNYGQNAAYALANLNNNSVIPFYFFDNDSNKFQLKKSNDNYNDVISKSLKVAVKWWLSYMGIKNFEAVLKDGIIYLEMDSGTTEEKVKVNLSEVGFGISQVFPIIIEGLRMPVTSTLITESPEAHLHPKMQMQLADFFISLALSSKNVIVETHSDHIVNRLVRRIIEDEQFDLKDKIAIYFINPSEEGAIVEEVKIDEDRGIVNWPDGFFDQTANEQEKIIRAGLKKRRAKRNQL